MTEPTLQFNLDGEWVDCPPVDFRIDTTKSPEYSEAEQALIRELAKEFVEHEGCTLADIKIETMRDFGRRQIKVLRK